MSQIEFGSNFDGQIGAIYLLNTDISDAASVQLMNFSGCVPSPTSLPLSPPVDIITSDSVGSDSFDFKKFAYVYDPARTRDDGGVIKARDVHSKIELVLNNTIPWKGEGGLRGPENKRA